MRIRDFDEAVVKLRPYLVDYLQEHGIDTSRLFSCINPTHDDSTPSCGIIKADELGFYCHGCSCSGDIFTAAHFLEDKPLQGPEFKTDNLMYLAKKYDIEIDIAPMTEHEIYVADTYRAYRETYNYIVNYNNVDLFDEVISARGWDKDTCLEYGIGTVDDFKKLRSFLKSLGFAATFIDDIDLGREDMFNPNCLVFAVKDERGRPVGFAARNLKYTPDKKNGQKYVNSRTTGAKCNIYRKGSRLFGLDRAIKSRSKIQDDKIYIFEGYADVVTAAKNGMKNCAALGGTNFSHEQASLLQRCGFYTLCLVLDGDATGQQRTADIAEDLANNIKGFDVSIVMLPGGMDPDEFIRKEGVDQFRLLREWSLFEWKIAQLEEGTPPEVICDVMIPFIAAERSAVRRNRLEHILSQYTKIDEFAIHRDVETVLVEKKEEQQREKQVALDHLADTIARRPEEAEHAIQETQGILTEITKRYDDQSLSNEHYILVLKEQKKIEETKDGSFSGFLLGPHLKPFEQALNGNWQQDVWCCLGSRENVGKSAFLLKLFLSIAAIEQNKAVCVYLSIDDTREQLTPRCVCILTGGRRLSINQVSDPNYHIRSGKASRRILELREEGYDKLLSLAVAGRFLMKDANDGCSLAYIESLIKYYKEKYPERNILFALDNFHKLPDFKAIRTGDERVRFKVMSTIMKNLATKYHISMHSTVEYPKLAQGVIPTNNNIAESQQIAYDANLLCHMYSDLHEWGDKAKHFHLSVSPEDGKPIRMPRIHINFGKNKITNFKGRQWYDFYPESSDFMFVDPSEIQEVESENNEGKDRFERIAANGLIE